MYIHMRPSAEKTPIFHYEVKKMLSVFFWIGFNLLSLHTGNEMYSLPLTPP